MDSLTGAAIAAVVAWASILLAALLPIPSYAFARLRWVGGLAIGLVALALVGLPVPGYVAPIVLMGGAVAAFAWPHDDAPQAAKSTQSMEPGHQTRGSSDSADFAVGPGVRQQRQP